MPTRPVGAHQRGFTLVELLVVITLLAGLATIAVRSLATVQDRAHFEATQRLLADCRAAIVGGGPVEGGFLADLGRLPQVVPGNPLTELVSKQDSVPASQLVTDAVDPEITLAVGWRGPYLDLPPGTDPNAALFDEFGNPLEVVVDTGRWLLRSLGADGMVGGTGFDQDVTLALIDVPSGIRRTRTELGGTVTLETDPGFGTDLRVTVFVYEPDPASGGLRARSTNATAVDPSTFPATFTYAFLGADATTPGRRVLRAYVHVVGETERPGDRRSLPISRLLPPGATTVDLVIP
ncbi:MAG: prepilin-type N-terminal cleavage/methylation domain-containing protein [Planctomycetes bacterium]|nr:prepilin-type N-terminal cleavage/methylation domain-containing protein [Planctomycetota bacterium]